MQAASKEVYQPRMDANEREYSIRYVYILLSRHHYTLNLYYFLQIKCDVM